MSYVMLLWPPNKEAGDLLIASKEVFGVKSFSRFTIEWEGEYIKIKVPMTESSRTKLWNAIPPSTSGWLIVSRGPEE